MITVKFLALTINKVVIFSATITASEQYLYIYICNYVNINDNLDIFLCFIINKQNIQYGSANKVQK